MNGLGNGLRPARVFVTVGAQMPFDRLVHAVDDWAQHHHSVDVYAQVGDTDSPPTHIEWTHRLDSDAFTRRVDEADLLVSHAGMGTIITALTRSKPLLAMPRLGERRETRNDHQVATAHRFVGRPGIYIANDVDDLVRLLDAGSFERPAPIANQASDELTRRIRDFIEQ